MIDQSSQLKRALDARPEPAAVCKVWLRDDDAVSVTTDHAAYFATCRTAGAVPLIGVIPAHAQREFMQVPGELRGFVGGADNAASDWPKGTRVCVHGWAHENYAPPDKKRSEFPQERDADAIRRDLQAGLETLRDGFGDFVLPVFIPPWNRIGAAATLQLANLGYTALSTFANAHRETPPANIQICNSTLDLVDWRGGRKPKPIEQVATEFLDLVAQSDQPIGVLTHTLGINAVPTNEALAAIGDWVGVDSRLCWQTPVEVFNQQAQSIGQI